MLDRRQALMLLMGSGLALVGRQAGAQPSTSAGEIHSEWRMTLNPALPNVLILGDSISEGYTLDVRRLLHGEANVWRPMKSDGLAPANCENTAYGLVHLDSWLGNKKWDVIYFNWGLHDLAYYLQAPSPLTGDAGLPINVVHGVQAVPLPQYRKNLTRIVERLKRTGASLIWGATTVVPPGAAGRLPEDVVKYNQAAAAIMRAHGVKIDDLYAATRKIPLEMHRAPNNVHYKEHGYETIARQVASSIQASLQQRHRHA